MFNKNKINWLEEEIRDIKKRLIRLECPHTDIKYEVGIWAEGIYSKKCVKCGKILAYLTKEEMLKERKEKAEKELQYCDEQLLASKKDVNNV